MPQHEASISIAADLGNISDIQSFVCQQARDTGVADALCPKLELVVEEIFVNIVNHAQPRKKEEVCIRCSVERSEDDTTQAFCISFQDWGPPFNPLEKTAPSLEQELEDRPIGGLGIFLVTQTASHCSYARQEESNLFRVCFASE